MCGSEGQGRAQTLQKTQQSQLIKARNYSPVVRDDELGVKDDDDASLEVAESRARAGRPSEVTRMGLETERDM